MIGEDERGKLLIKYCFRIMCGERLDKIKQKSRSVLYLNSFTSVLKFLLHFKESGTIRDDTISCGLSNNDHEKLKSEDPHSMERP